MKKNEQSEIVIGNKENRLSQLEIIAPETPVVMAAVLPLPAKEVAELLKKKSVKPSYCKTEEEKLRTPDMLISVDYYRNIVKGRMERDPNNDSLVTIETILGWCLSEPVSMSSLSNDSRVRVNKVHWMC